METMIDAAAKIALAFATALCSYLFGKLKERDAIRSTKDKADLVLLRDKLIYYYSKYMPEQEMPQAIYENMTEMFECYTALGGNGTVKHMYDEMKKVKIR